MKATDIFAQRIITHNCDIEESMKPEIIERLAVHNDIRSFNYERLFVSGKLQAVLNDPKSAIPLDIQFRVRNEGGYYDGWVLMKGVDYILPLIFLHNALIKRLERDTKKTEVIFQATLRGDVNLSEEEWLEFRDDITEIYEQHFDLANYFFDWRLSNLSDEECQKKLQEVESIDLTVAILQ